MPKHKDIPTTAAEIRTRLQEMDRTVHHLAARGDVTRTRLMLAEMLLLRGALIEMEGQDADS